jgi:galactoside O-acetyltransferase
MNSFYTKEELTLIGFKKYGENVLISRFASLYNPEKIVIGNNVRIDDFCILSGEIVFQNNIHISAYSALFGKYGIIMEDFTGLSPRCTIFSASDDFSGDFLISPMNPEKYTKVIGGKVLIKKFSQVGAGSIVMPDLTINEGVAIGAMSFVKKSLEAWAIYAGNPIRYIKQRKKGLLEYYNEITNEK